MKASHLFLFGVIFAFIWGLIKDLIQDIWNVDGGYSSIYVFFIITIIILWYAIDNKLNRTYQVKKWDE